MILIVQSIRESGSRGSLLMMGIATSLCLSAAPVEIPDATLQTVVREKLGLTDGQEITSEGLERLTEIKTNDEGIENLQGLESARNLTELSLSHSSISDLSALEGLTRLTELSLFANQSFSLTLPKGLMIGTEKNGHGIL